MEPIKASQVGGRGEEEILEPLPGKPTWSGSISMGLVNIPVRGFPNHHRAKGQLSNAASEVQNSHFL